MEFVQPIRDKKTLETMKKILRSNNLRDYNLFILGINSGLRISDLLTLKVSDVCDSKGKIKDRIVIREKKTNKLKDFPLGEPSKKALKEYMVSLNPAEALFASRKGYKPITRQQAYRILNDAARAIGIKGPNWHPFTQKDVWIPCVPGWRGYYPNPEVVKPFFT